MSFEGKGLPCDLEAERAILGAILLDNNLLRQVIGFPCSPSEFFIKTHSQILTAMIEVELSGRPIDLLTLTDYLRTRGELELVGGATYIASLIDGVPRTDSVSYYIEIVKRKSLFRNLIRGGNLIMADAFEEVDTGEIENSLERLLLNIRSQDSFRREPIPLGDLAQAELERLEEHQARGPGITGISTGFSDWDDVISGFDKELFYVIAARPSHGKSAIALQAARSAARESKTVLIIPLEGGARSLVVRLLCQTARVDSHRYRRGYIQRDEWVRLAEALREFHALPIYIDPSSDMTIESIRSTARRYKGSKIGLDLLIVDYFQLIKSRKKFRDDYAMLRYISGELNNIKTELHIPVVALAQVTRQSTQRSDPRPQLQDLKECGQLEQDADVVTFVYREEMHKPTETNEGLAELLIRKQRDGPLGIVNLAFLKRYALFQALSLRKE